MTVIVIIPARGGSKGIPRKNLRPLNAKPLIAYAIEAAVGAASVDKVIVNTDDSEIGLMAERFGAVAQYRPSDLSADDVPLDPVIRQAVQSVMEGLQQVQVPTAVITVQPTSPLVTSASIEEALRIFIQHDCDTVVSVTPDRHLRWAFVDGEFLPQFSARVNRQLLPDEYRETGAVVVSRADMLINEGIRFGRVVKPHVIPGDQSIDIDSYQDLAVADFLLKRKKIVFVVVGSNELGLGHAYRALMIAHEFVDHDVSFLCPEGSDLAADLIRRMNYEVSVLRGEEVVSWLVKNPQDLVVNDILDTQSDYVLDIKATGTKVANFEDLGRGAEVADIVVNALYPHQVPMPNVLIGEEYFCLRDEFLFGLEGCEGDVSNPVKRILVTFGGTDDRNLTLLSVRSLKDLAMENSVLLDVVVGPGYAHYEALEPELASFRAGGANIEFSGGTARISEHMAMADIAISSGGRTVFELASLRIPTIVICQNQRETTHTFASPVNGFLNLGLCPDSVGVELLGAVDKLMRDPALRREMSEKMGKKDLRNGKRRVIHELRRLLGS